MGIIKGLKAINDEIDRPRSASISGPRVRWLKLDDGQSVKIRFANEVDDSSAHYNEDNGLSIVVSEHQNPQDYKRKAVCTLDDEGRCFGCEMHRRNPKDGWKPRLRFYTNVVVDDKIEEPYIAVWSMGVAKSATFNTIRDFAGDGNSITNMEWKVKRNGKGTETNYTLIPGPVDSDSFDWSRFEIFPLESAIRQIPYSDQESFYLGFDNPATSTSVDW